MYGLSRPEYVPERWHVFIGQLTISWISCLTVLFANRALPMISNVGIVFILGGVLSTILVCAIMPHQTGAGYATSSFVWKDWMNQTGYTNNGFVFLAGMLNGAYSVGTPDCCAHLAEEIPNPKRNVPLAMAAQMSIGFFAAFFYMIAIFYATTDLDAVLSSPYFPLMQIYIQATGSTAGTMGLLFVIFLPLACCCIGTFITAGRGVWTLARDDAIPFSSTLGKISPRFKNPFNATLLCGCFSTVLGAIYVASTTAFNAFVGSFVVLSTLSYLAAILPFILTKRFSKIPGTTGNNMTPGPFQMSNAVGYLVNGVSCAYIVVFVVIFCFPYQMPVNAVNMNYASLLAGAVTLASGGWWFVGGKGYVGPRVLVREEVVGGDGVGKSE